ncbi:MAG TPA: cytochrome c oxidase subunit II [Actinocrinis sp.]|nr:cytochrome c oxidase subunit II [Actinocrinis sp.]
MSQYGSERRPRALSDPARGRRAPASRRRRLIARAALAGAVLVVASGCGNNSFTRLGFPDPASAEAPTVLHLWQGSWIAAFAVGALVWGLILWTAFFHRRSRHGIEVPPQTKYNIPIELLYTAVPTIMVAVLFYFTAKDESQLLKITPDQSTSINVVGRQWSWSFNYNYDAATGQQFAAGGPSVYEAGTPGQPPHLYLPLGEKVKFTLTSPDVIHSFWVPAFLFKLDVVPGRVNQFELTPTKQGEFIGECAELCGVDHSRMLFWVDVVPPDQYKAHLAQLQQQGNTGQLPIGCGPNAGVGENGIPCRVGPMNGIKGKNSTGGTAW